MAKELFADYVKEKKLREPQVFFTFRDKLKLSVPLTVVTIFCFFVQCIIKQLLDSIFVISRIIKVSARGRNECVTNAPQRTSAGRLLVMLKECNLSCKIVKNCILS